MFIRPQFDDVRRIAGQRDPWCVSIYGTSTGWLRGNRPSEESASQIHAAVDGLREAGAPPATVEAIRHLLRATSEPLDDRQEPLGEGVRGVGVFATESGVATFALTTSPEPCVVVADRFRIGPLLAAVLDMPAAVFVLALSERQVRLIDVTSPTLDEVPVPQLPHDLRSTIDLDLTGDRNSLSHLKISEDPKERLREYARAIAGAVAPVLEQAHPLLVIAAAEPLADIYRDVDDYPLTAAGILGGNWDDQRPFAIAQAAEPVVREHRRTDLAKLRARFLESEPGRRSTDVSVARQAAREGALDTLLVDVDHLRHGDGTERADAIDELIRESLETRARVVMANADELPTQQPIAAIFRWTLAGQVRS